MNMRSFKSIKLLSRVLVILLLFSTSAHASKEAVVIVDKAIIYSDIERQSAIGFLKKGKKIKVAEHTQNRGVVYPIVISNKIAYISTEDVSTVLTMEDEEAVFEAERFKEVANKSHFTQNVSLSYSIHQATLLKDTSANQDKNTHYTMTGVTVKGERFGLKKKLGLGFLFHYFKGEDPDNDIRLQEIAFGLGPNFSLMSFSRMKIRFGIYGIVSPFFQYELNPDFIKNGYALGAEAMGNIHIFVTKRLGVEFQGAFLSQKVFGMDFPKPYKNYNPVVVGAIVSGGITYQF